MPRTTPIEEKKHTPSIVRFRGEFERIKERIYASSSLDSFKKIILQEIDKYGESRDLENLLADIQTLAMTLKVSRKQSRQSEKKKHASKETALLPSEIKAKMSPTEALSSGDLTAIKNLIEKDHIAPGIFFNDLDDLISTPNYKVFLYLITQVYAKTLESINPAKVILTSCWSLPEKRMVLKALKERGVMLNAFENAAFSGNLDLLKKEIKNSSAEKCFRMLNAPKGESQPMQLAAMAGHFKFIEYLVSESLIKGSRSPIKLEAKTINLAFHSAITYGQTKVAIYLFEQCNATLAEPPPTFGCIAEDYKQDIEKHGTRKIFPILLAACCGKIDLVKYFIKKGGAVVRLSDPGLSAQFHAANCYHLSTFKYLVENYPVSADYTAVVENALEFGNWAVLIFLIKSRKVKLSALGRDGGSIWDYLVSKGDIALMTDLFPFDEDPNYESLAISIGSHGSLELFQTIEASIKNPEARKIFYGLVLRNASKSGALDIIKYLITVHDLNIEVLEAKTSRAHIYVDGFNMSGCDPDKTPLSLAAEAGVFDAVRCLVEEGKANVSAIDSTGKTPLMLAAKNGRIDVVQYLIEKANAKIDVTDYKGQSPLDIAVKAGSAETAIFLLPYYSSTVQSYFYLINEMVLTAIKYYNESEGDLDLTAYDLDHFLTSIHPKYSYEKFIKDVIRVCGINLKMLSDTLDRASPTLPHFFDALDMEHLSRIQTPILDKIISSALKGASFFTAHIMENISDFAFDAELATKNKIHAIYLLQALENFIFTSPASDNEKKLIQFLHASILKQHSLSLMTINQVTCDFFDKYAKYVMQKPFLLDLFEYIFEETKVLGAPRNLRYRSSILGEDGELCPKNKGEAKQSKREAMPVISSGFFAQSAPASEEVLEKQVETSRYGS